jgi:hypothetical protein
VARPVPCQVRMPDIPMPKGERAKPHKTIPRERARKGRPPAWSPALEKDFLDTLETVTCGSAELCRRTERFPGASTLWRHCIKSPAFRDKLDAAKERQMESIIMSSFDDLSMHTVNENGTEESVRLAHRVAVSNQASKLAGQMTPRRFGPKSEVKITADEGLTAQLDKATAAVRKRKATDGT